jgi:hypothetical protein
MLKNSTGMKGYFVGNIQHFLRHVPPAALLDTSVDRIAREL